MAECVLRGIGHVQEPVRITVLAVDAGDGLMTDREHALCSHAEKDGFLRVELHALADHVRELAHGQIRWHQKLFLVDLRHIDVAPGALANQRHHVGVFATNLLRLGLPLFERSAVFETRGRGHPSDLGKMEGASGLSVPNASIFFLVSTARLYIEKVHRQMPHCRR